MFWPRALLLCIAAPAVLAGSGVPVTPGSTQSVDLEGQCSAANAHRGCQSVAGKKFAHHTDIPKEMFDKGHLKPLGSHRPPDSEVDVLPYMIGPQDFYQYYVARHKPVVIKGVAKDWNATRLWTDEYLAQKYGHFKLHMETKDDDKFNLPPSRTIGEFLKVYKEANLYLVDELPPPMRKEVTMPLCVRCEEIASRFFVSYFWMSNGGTSSQLHIDTDENILTVIRGRKDILLISPLYSNDVYADESRIIGVSPINTSHVNFLTHPRMANLHYMTAHLDEGDMLYLPQMWWHYVYSAPGRQQALAMWWKSIPFQKTFAKGDGRQGSRLKTPEERDQDTRTTSFARWLEQYSQWVIDIEENIDRPACNNMVKLMSDYAFETDKPDWRDDLTGGRAITDDPDEDLEKGALGMAGEGTRCYFDIHNKESPCYQHFCGFGPPPGREGMEPPEGEEPEEEEDKDEESSLRQEMTCIRYMLDYCQRYEDRGCVIELPQMLNKRTEDEFEMLKKVPTKFRDEQ